MARWLAYWLQWVALFCIAVLSLVPGHERPQTGAPGQLEHVIAYCGTALLVGLAAGPGNRLYRRGTLLILYAGVLEVLQIWVPGRTAELIDFASSTLGIVIGLAAAHVALALVGQRR